MNWLNSAQKWTKLIQKYKSLINNDVIINDILTTTKPLNIDKNNFYLLNNDSFLYIYLKENKIQLQNLYNSMFNTNINLIIVNDAEYKKINENLNTENNLNNECVYLDHNLTFENYIVGDFNYHAYTLIKSLLDKKTKTFNPIFLYSSVGLGKTHLVSALANSYIKKYNGKAFYIDAQNFLSICCNAFNTNNTTDIEKIKNQFDQYELVIIDDIQYLSNKNSTKEVLFSIFNTLINNDKKIVLTCDRHPTQLNGFEDRFISRFSSGITIKIKEPDEKSIKQIINENNKENNVIMDDNSINMLTQWFFKDIRMLLGALNRIYFFHNNKKQIINEEIIRDVLDIENLNFKNNSYANNKVNPKSIISAVAKLYNITPENIIGKSRKQNYTHARHIVMYILREELNLSLKEIGGILGNRDHTTIINGVEKIKESLLNNDDFKKTINNIVLLK